MTSKEKITDIQYLINEFYSTQESRGELNEHTKNSRKLFNRYCKDIKKDLESLEILKILKKWLIVEETHDDLFPYEIRVRGSYVSTRSGLWLSKEEYEKIKEWLNGK